MFIPVYGALEIIPFKTKTFQKAHHWPLPLTCSECNHRDPGFPSSGSKHISQVLIYQDPCVKSMKVRLVRGTCVEIKGEGIYSSPRGKEPTEHFLCRSWPVLCWFLSAVFCNLWLYLVLSSPPSQCLPTTAWLEGSLPAGSTTARHPLAEAPCD